ncbi:hypothetical protein CDL15_Pgr011411 [Punica granatum]|uniref:Uncharacterized protein n=1 Tax=Punica granatum TaxID=22663 RepID=A0A218WEK7_PUNGR|nr:hypothetical protein CDL15_Pgr011411 [Punica granatum]
MSDPPERSVDWTLLPEGLLGSVLQKLPSVHDYVRFASVCKNWLTVARHQSNERLGDATRRQLPLLLMPTADNSETHRALYDVARGRVLGSRWHVPYNMRCCGSSFGWLIFAEETLELILFNPSFGETIRLPRVIRPPTKEEIGDSYYNHEYEFAKVVLSADPSMAPDTYEVAVLNELTESILFFRSGDEVWLNIGTPEEDGQFQDIIYYRGRLYATNGRGLVLSFEFHRGDNHPKDSSALARTIADLTLRGDPDKSYLAESLSGHLLLVRRFMNDYLSGFAGGVFEIGGNEYKFDSDKQPLTSSFHVYKLIPVTEDEHGLGHCHSKRLTMLADEALFLGHCHSMSVSASEYPGCKPNSVYFMDDYLDDPPPYQPLGAIDIGVFSLEDEHIERLNLIDPSQSHMPPPIWIAPKAKIS